MSPVCVCSVHHPQRSSDGSLSQEEESGPTFGKVSELQEVVDRQTADLGQMKERMAAMVSRISELEEDLDTARKDLIKSEDMNTRLQRDLREVGRTKMSQAAPFQCIPFGIHIVCAGVIIQCPIFFAKLIKTVLSEDAQLGL